MLFCTVKWHFHSRRAHGHGKVRNANLWPMDGMVRMEQVNFGEFCGRKSFGNGQQDVRQHVAVEDGHASGCAVMGTNARGRPLTRALAMNNFAPQWVSQMCQNTLVLINMYRLENMPFTNKFAVKIISSYLNIAYSISKILPNSPLLFLSIQLIYNI
jgi:hypothetical protein